MPTKHLSKYNCAAFRRRALELQPDFQEIEPLREVDVVLPPGLILDGSVLIFIWLRSCVLCPWQGWPIFLLAEASLHTRNIKANSRVSLLCQTPREGNDQPVRFRWCVAFRGVFVLPSGLIPQHPSERAIRSRVVLRLKSFYYRRQTLCWGIALTVKRRLQIPSQCGRKTVFLKPLRLPLCCHVEVWFDGLKQMRVVRHNALGLAISVGITHVAEKVCSTIGQHQEFLQKTH